MTEIKNIEEQKIWQILEEVVDPEIPVLSVIDLGIIRDVKLLNSGSPSGAGGIEIIITPTYSGCPAMDMIAMNIKFAMIEHGYKNVIITSVLSPAWTTDWMTEAGKIKLKEYGIAPPGKLSDQSDESIECPQCHSHNTKLISEFGSTACKSLYQCNDCKEPFDHFKCH
ncbi:MAG: 1,2-phenylacetyl-CoA epoxidase subunit PaaD [Ferruginibacter sp.]